MIDFENRNACNEFLERSMERVLRLARSELAKTGCIDAYGHARDVLGDISLKVLQKWVTLRSPEDALFKITQNAARTHAKKCRRESPQEIEESAIPFFISGPADPTAINQAGIYLEELSSQLDDTDRKIMNYIGQGYTFNEISVFLDMPSSTIRSRYSRAARKLRRFDSQTVDAELSHVTTD